MSHYFPNHEALVISLVIGFQNGGAIVTSCLDAIYRRYQPSVRVQTLFLSYLFIIVVPFGVFYILASPLGRPSRKLKRKEIAIEVVDYSDLNEAQSQAQADNSQGVMVSSDADADNKEDLGISREQATIIAVVSNDSSGSHLEKVSEDVVVTRTATQDLVTLEMLLFSLFVLITVLQFNYYPTILRQISGDKVAQFNGTSGMLQILASYSRGVTEAYCGYFESLKPCCYCKHSGCVSASKSALYRLAASCARPASSNLRCYCRQGWDPSCCAFVDVYGKH